MRTYLKKLLYQFDFLLYIFVKIKSIFYKASSQSDESKILDKLIEKFNLKKNFLEIGFSPWEYNCSNISNFNKGYIIDANKVNIKIGKWLLKNTLFICEFIDLDNIEEIIKKINININILSLDIDGNDYYIMEKLIKLDPSLIICEYNPAFHLRPITTVYKKHFDRTKEHKDWLYYGCSIKSWEIFMKKNGYSMVAISKSGVNVFFVKDQFMINKNEIINPENSFIDYDWPEGESHIDQWKKIKDMKFKVVN